jgi:hypothetical protein
MEEGLIIDNVLLVCQKITTNINLSVILFYTYQLRIVHIKLSAETPNDSI